MEIVQEKLVDNNWTELLTALPIKEKCLIVTKDQYKTLRNTATRIQKKLSVKFTFKTDGDHVKIWKKDKIVLS
jgi:hypothetical protein